MLPLQAVVLTRLPHPLPRRLCGRHHLGSLLPFQCPIQCGLQEGGLSLSSARLVASSAQVTTNGSSTWREGSTACNGGHAREHPGSELQRGPATPSRGPAPVQGRLLQSAEAPPPITATGHFVAQKVDNDYTGKSTTPSNCCASCGRV